MMQVRGAFVAGIGAAPGAARDPARFCLACADYLVFSMDRLHAQDQTIHALLRSRVPLSERDAHGQLDTLATDLAASRTLVDDLRRQADDLRRAGTAGLAAFETGARRFTAAFQSQLQPRRNPLFRYTDSLFGEADWTQVAGVTAASLAQEERLFQAVRQSAPPDCDPERMSAGHAPANGPAIQQHP